MMSITAAVKNGFSIVHRQWQLIVAQFVLSLIGCAGFFIIVGIPLVATVIVLGLDVTEIARLREFLAEMDNPFSLIKRYLGIGIVLLSALMVYAVFAFVLWIYGLGGSAGIIGSALKSDAYRFSLREFMAYARRYLMPLTGYTALLGLLLIAALFVLGLFGGLLVAGISLLGDSLWGKFFGVFSGLLLVLLAVVLMLLTMAATLYGAGILAIEKTGAMETLKLTARRLREGPEAVGLFFVLFLGYLLIYGFLAGFSILLGIVPIVGQVLLVPYQLFMYALQGYLNLVILASLMAFYLAQSHAGSIPLSDTSAQEVSEQGPLQRD